MQPLRALVLQFLKHELAEPQLFVLKDPRFCRLLPFWLDTLQEFGATPNVILVVRNPLEVSASLSRRNHLPVGHSLLLWLRYSLEAKRDSRGCARTLLSYESLLDDWSGATDRVARELNIVWPASAQSAGSTVPSFLSPDLRHHLYTAQDLLSRSDLSPWVKTAFNLLNACAQDSKRERELIIGFDQLRQDVEHADPFLNLLSTEQISANARRMQIDESTFRLARPPVGPQRDKPRNHCLESLVLGGLLPPAGCRAQRS